MTALEDAVKAAAEAGQGVSHDFLVECGLTDNEADAAINAVAEAAVAAAAPILLAAERARLAAACRAEADKFDRSSAFESHSRRTQLQGHASGLSHAARIVEARDAA